MARLFHRENHPNSAEGFTITRSSRLRIERIRRIHSLLRLYSASQPGTGIELLQHSSGTNVLDMGESYHPVELESVERIRKYGSGSFRSKSPISVSSCQLVGKADIVADSMFIRVENALKLGELDPTDPGGMIPRF